MLRNIILTLLLLVSFTAFAQPPKYIFKKETFTADTGICSVNTPVTFRIYTTIEHCYYGLRYGTELDYGDGNTERFLDTINHIGWLQNDGYAWKHTYADTGIKTVRAYFLDSTLKRVDSVVVTYNVGGCRKGVGVLYCDSNPNGQYDKGEDIYDRHLIDFENNGNLITYLTDSYSHYAIPVFPGDSIILKGFTRNNYLTHEHLDTVIGKALGSSEWGYFFKPYLPDNICTDIEGYLAYGYATGSSGNFTIMVDYGDGNRSSYGVLKGGVYYEKYVYNKPGRYRMKSFLCDSYIPIHVHEQWINVDSCKKVKVQLYYDMDSNCMYTPGEPVVENVALEITSQKRSNDNYNSDSAGLVYLNVFPEDTMRVDSAAWFYIPPYYGDTYGIENNVQCSQDINMHDTLFFAAYKPRIITGKVFLDKNNNCIQDSADRVMPGKKLIALSNDGLSVETSVSDSLGEYSFCLARHKHYNVYIDSQTIGGYRISCSGYIDTIYSIDFRDKGKDFSYICNANKSAAITAYSNGVYTGLINELIVYPLYSNCDTDSAIIVVVLDTSVVYAGSTFTPSSITGDTVSFFIENLADAQQFPMKIYYNLKQGVNNGYLCHNISISPHFYDSDLKDNNVTICDSITEKKDKQKILSIVHDSLGNKTFIYSIHITNTDTVAVNTMQLIDTLDNALDTNSVVLLESSHPVWMHGKGNVLNFMFNRLFLKPYIVDSTNSSAFVRFSIKPMQPTTATIPNKAFVYFDNKLAGTTNTAYYHYYDTGTVSVPLNPERFQQLLHPNPTTGKFFIIIPFEESAELKLMTLQGKEVYRFKVHKGKNELDISALPQGMYLVHYHVGGNSYFGKIVKQ